MRQYLDLCQRVLDEGVIKQNRTGINTIGIHGAMMQFDLRDGFPAVTTKKLAYKSCFAEMLGFLRGYDNAADFRALGCKVWDANSEADYWTSNSHYAGDGDLGRIYGVQARGWNAPHSPVVVQPRVEEKPHPERNDELVSGFGIGDVAPDNELDTHLRSIWYGMLRRCYEPDYKQFHNYGGRGVVVCRRWHLLSTFLSDVKRLPNWHYKKKDLGGYELDKDYYSSDRYSPETCMWLSVPDNRLYAQSQGLFSVSNGSEYYEFISMTEAACQLGLNRAHISECLSGDRTIHAGYSFDWVDADNPYRYQAPVDQLRKVVDDLSQGIDNRREIVTHWNPGEMNQMALPPCHLLYQFGIQPAHDIMTMTGRGDESVLNLSMYQRSCDLPLGVPFNIAGYAWLLSVIAKVTGHRAGVFTHFMHDVHIYENQIDDMKVQLERSPFELPRLMMSEQVNTFEDLEEGVVPGDFHLAEYSHHDPIKYEFAV